MLTYRNLGIVGWYVEAEARNLGRMCKEENGLTWFEAGMGIEP